VRTLAGNGAKAADDYVGGRKGRMQQLNSPWDLALDAQVGGLMRGYFAESCSAPAGSQAVG
jgi:hypothetical protein